MPSISPDEVNESERHAAPPLTSETLLPTPPVAFIGIVLSLGVTVTLRHYWSAPLCVSNGAPLPASCDVTGSAVHGECGAILFCPQTCSWCVPLRPPSHCSRRVLCEVSCP
ncbi:unnamed protein product [Pleuronectes platessa]|uniref:Uncharacterized protein n=1 Tax=Pleuronectes platessa TaxID=8262 RepID=A0A9N7YPL6_PLEPL|nr:unnamed protein product [Pleuronectes platessa]